MGTGGRLRQRHWLYGSSGIFGPILSHAFILISNPEELGLSKEVNREGYSKCPD